jgi:hypothetical protein
LFIELFKRLGRNKPILEARAIEYREVRLSKKMKSWRKTFASSRLAEVLSRSLIFEKRP